MIQKLFCYACCMLIFFFHKVHFCVQQSVARHSQAISTALDTYTLDVAATMDSHQEAADEFCVVVEPLILNNCADENASGYVKKSGISQAMDRLSLGK